MKLLVAALMVILTLSLGGCAQVSSLFGSVPKMEVERLTVVEDQGSQESNQAKGLDKAISDYIINKTAYKAIGGTVFEAHELYGTEEKQGGIVAYVWSYQQEYLSEKGVLQKGAASSTPMVLILNRDTNEKYTVKEHKTPQDGGNYTSSVKQLFPEKYQEMIMIRSNVNTLEQIVRQKAENYFSSAAKADTGQTPNIDSLKDGVLQKGTGEYTGQIDGNSIELKLDGIQEEKAFRLSEDIKNKFDSYGLNSGDRVEITYEKNGYDQLVLRSLIIQKSAPPQDPIETKFKTDTGRYNGQIDSSSIEVKISGVPETMPPQVLRLSESVKEKFDTFKLTIGDTIKFNYIVNEFGQKIISEIAILSRIN